MHDASMRSLATRLQTLHDVRAQLYLAPSADELCRRAVELGCERLGFDRISIWLTQDKQEAHGSYGTDEFGTVRDERHVHIVVAPTSAIGRIFHGDIDMLIETQNALYDATGTIIGQGTQIFAALWDGLQVLGAVCADNLISQTPYSQEDGEILGCYADIIGHFYQQLLSEEAHQQAVHQCAETTRTLLDGESDLYAFFESMPDIAVVTTPQGDILYINSAAEQLLGYSTEELASKHILEWHPPELRGEAEVIFAAMLRGEQSQCLLPLIAKDGTHIPVKTRVWLGTWRNVSCVYAIIQNRCEAHEAELRFEQIFRQNPSPMAITHIADGQFIDVNEAFLEEIGYTRHEVIGRTAADLRICPEAAWQEHIIQQLCITCHIDQVEMLVMQKDGSIRTGLFFGTYLTYHAQPHFLLVMMDITERKQVESQMRLLADMLDIAPNSITIHDEKGNFLYANQQTFTLHGYTADEFMRLNLHDLDVPESAALIVARIQRIGEDGEAQFEVIHHRKDQTLFPLEVFVKCVSWEGRPALLSIATDITVRKRAEEALRRERERLANILEGTNVGSWEWNVQTGETIFNERWAEIIGYSLEEIAPVSIYTWMNFTHPDDLHISGELLQRHFSGELPYYECEARMRHKNGEWVWVLDRGKVAVWTEDGKPLHMMGTHQDITERKQSEELLRESEERFRGIAESMSDVLFFTDRLGVITYISPSARQVFGYELAEMLGRPFTDFLQEDQIPIAFKHFSHTLTSGEPTSNIELTMKRCGSEVFFGELTASAVIKNDRTTGTLGVIRDITDRKEADNALRESEQRHRDYITNTPYGVFVVNEIGQYIQVNLSACHLTGYSEQELLSMSITDMQPVETVEDGLRHFQTVIREGQASGELLFQHKSGEQRWWSVSAVKLSNTRYLGFCHDITDRKRSEEEAERVQALNVTVIDSIPGAFYMLDENGFFIHWNTYQRDEIVGKPDDLVRNTHVLDTIHPDDRELVQSKIANVLDNGVDESIEARVLLHGGPAFRWLLMTGKRLLVDSRPFVLGIGIDITARKQAEQRLETLHRQLDSVLVAVPDLLIAIDHDLNILYSNAKGHDLVVQPDPVKQMKCFSRFKLLDSPCEDCSALPVFATGQSVEREMTNPADGRVREVRAFPIFARDGTVEAVVEYVRDVTERKQAEQALSESEERNRLLSDVTMEGILLHHNGAAIDMNTAMATMLGYERDALLQKDFLQFIHDDDVQFVRDNMVKDVAPPYSVRMRRRNGEYFHAEIESRNFLYQGSLIRVSAVRDISERKALEAQLVQAQKMESVGRLAGGVAHDFNNMLGAIIGYTELALLKLEDTSPLRADLGEIKRAAERSADLTRQLLAFARKQVVAPRVVDLNATVAGMLRMLQRLIGEDIRLAWHPAIAQCLLHIDPSQLDQILANLCVNARDAIGGIGTLTIETQQANIDDAYCATHPEALPGAYVVLLVSDTGCGMTAETLGHIFEPFFTTKGVGEGTGLGLATVYGILKQNRGFIDVYSEPGQGTTFKLYFPRYVDAIVPTTATVQAISPPCGTETVLIVEDEPAILALATRILEQQGYTVLPARTPSEALHIVGSYHGVIHLVITDVIMPEMTGRQVVERIQSRFAAIGAIFMSGYTANVIAHHGVLESGVHFLQKPFTLKDLLGKVREVLDATRT